MSLPVISVVELYRFPVKSMQGERLEEVVLGPLGISGDRRFAVREVETGKVLSAKRPKVGRLLLTCGATTAPDGSIGVEIGGAAASTADLVRVDALLSEYLGFPAHLDGVPGADDAYESYWPEIEGLALSDVTVDFPIAMGTEKGTFVDLAALHMLTTSSLDHLRGLAPQSAIDVSRFRPSMVFEVDGGAAGFVENGWVDRGATLGQARLQFGTVSPRCVMTTLAQPGLPDDHNVLRTIADHNRQEVGGFGDFACLGIYAEVTQPGRVRLGDELVLDPVA